MTGIIITIMQCQSCASDVEPQSTECPVCGAALEGDATVTYTPMAPVPGLTPDQAADLDGVSGYALVVERGPQAGMTYVLTSGTITVGRHPESDIFLDDITVSRHHCRFINDDSELSVEDSGSTNGTYVNSARVDLARLVPGDEVLVGRFHLIVARGDG